MSRAPSRLARPVGRGPVRLGVRARELVGRVVAGGQDEALPGARLLHLAVRGVRQDLLGGAVLVGGGEGSASGVVGVVGALAAAAARPGHDLGCEAAVLVVAAAGLAAAGAAPGDEGAPAVVGGAGGHPAGGGGQEVAGLVEPPDGGDAALGGLDDAPQGVVAQGGGDGGAARLLDGHGAWQVVAGAYWYSVRLPAASSSQSRRPVTFSKWRSRSRRRGPDSGPLSTTRRRPSVSSLCSWTR